MSLSHTHLSLSLTFHFHYSRLSSLLLSSIADVATETPFYLAKVGQPGGAPRTIARFHDSFRGSLPQIAYNLGIPRKQRWNFLACPPVGRSMIHARKKRLYDDGLVYDNKKKLGLTQWKIFLQVKKDMSQEKPITLRQQHNKKRRRRDTNSQQRNEQIQAVCQNRKKCD